jgi:hypothetical protein
MIRIIYFIGLTLAYVVCITNASMLNITQWHFEIINIISYYMSWVFGVTCILIETLQIKMFSKGLDILKRTLNYKLQKIDIDSIKKTTEIIYFKLYRYNLEMFFYALCCMIMLNGNNPSLIVLVLITAILKLLMMYHHKNIYNQSILLKNIVNKMN